MKPMLILVGLGLCAAFGYFVLRQTGTELPSPGGGASRRVLRRMVSDPQVAERLIRRELERRPGITEREAIRLAIQRIRADRRH